MQKQPYLSDPKLVPRVQKYLEDNIDKPNLDISVIADELQKTYREYSRRKRNAFKASVQKAYTIIMDGLSDDDDNDNDNAEVEQVKEENSEGHFQNNMINNQLVEVYTKSSRDLSEIGGKETINNCNAEEKEQKAGKRKLDDATVPPSKKKKKIKLISTELPKVPKVTLKDVVGIDSTIDRVRDLLVRMTWPALNKLYPISAPSRAILIHGPSGCGKTLLARAIAGHLNYPLVEAQATSFVEGISGESEKLIREFFEKGVSSLPCVLFIDNIDVITNSQSHSQKDMYKRIVCQLASCIDELNKNENAENVLLICATQNPYVMDPILKTHGRFGEEIKLGMPNEESRIAILKHYTSTRRIAEGFDWNRVGAVTPGYVGADLVALIKKATDMVINRYLNTNKDGFIKSIKCNQILNRSIEDVNMSSPKIGLVESKPNSAPVMENGSVSESNMIVDDSCSLSLWNWSTAEKDLITVSEKNVITDWVESIIFTENDFLQAAKTIQPASIKEGLLSIPNITWNDVGSLKHIKKELMSTILGATTHKKIYKLLGLTTPAGILLCGPPGCGKTLVAKALANEAGINFISVKGPELLNMYVGESEKAVRMCFGRAKNSAPCVIFFDELDALCPRRSAESESVSSRVVNQMLTEMDGVEDREGVYLLAATNKPEAVDPAVLRPGRLDKILYVDMPSPADRMEILKAITKNFTIPRISSDVNLVDLCNSDKLSGYTGADLSQLVKEAGYIHFDRIINGAVEGVDNILTNEDFEKAIAKIRPSVSEQDREFYKKMKELYTPPELPNTK